MNYNDAIEYIQSLSGLGSRPGTDAISGLLARLGDPQNRLQVIHIAGTNGKGSVFTFLAEMLKSAGYVTGRYISPAIFTYLEKYQIDGEYMTENEFCDIMEEIIPICDEMVNDGLERPTAFETETAAAFLYFYKKDVDVLLLETGMGGEGDATNVVERPLCTVLASISRDHMQVLGDKLTDILEEKMGIMRPGVPCVSYELNPELKSIWLGKCEELNCKGVMLDKSQITIEKQTMYGTDITFKGENYHISMPGTFQIYNAALAIMTAQMIDKISDSDIDLKNEDIKCGLSRAIWPGRFQLLKENDSHIPVIIDGSHNEEGWLGLKENISYYLSDYQLIFVCGVLADKEYDRMIEILAPHSDILIALTPDNPRALSGVDLIHAAADSFAQTYVAGDAVSGLNMALEIGQHMKNPAVLVFGSLSFIGDIIKTSEEWQNGQDK